MGRHGGGEWARFDPKRPLTHATALGGASVACQAARPTHAWPHGVAWPLRCERQVSPATTTHTRPMAKRRSTQRSSAARTWPT